MQIADHRGDGSSREKNYLAVSCEILSYLRRQGQNGEIIDGSSHYMAEGLQLHRSTYITWKRLSRTRLGVIGKPSP